MANEIKAIIFDMGGVILRTEDKTSRTELAKRFGLSREQIEDLVFNSPSAMAATVGSIGEREHWQTVWQGLQVPEAEWEDCEAAFWKGDFLDQELISFLRSQQGTRTTALLSNAWSGARDALTYKHPCLDAFDVSVFSYEVNLAKPDPAIYNLILARVGVEAHQAIFVDDNEANIISAGGMGINAIRFLNTRQALSEIRSLID
jgi:HAD superfamily hydrolase (TIGR01509 family)